MSSDEALVISMELFKKVPDKYLNHYAQFEYNQLVDYYKSLKDQFAANKPKNIIELYNHLQTHTPGIGSNFCGYNINLKQRIIRGYPLLSNLNTTIFDHDYTSPFLKTYTQEELDELKSEAESLISEIQTNLKIMFTSLKSNNTLLNKTKAKAYFKMSDPLTLTTIYGDFTLQLQMSEVDRLYDYT